MSELEKKALETFGKVIPKLSERDKERVLNFGEGMAFVIDRQKANEEIPEEKQRSDKGERDA